VGVRLLTNSLLIVPHAPRGNASADALRRNRMTQSVMGGFKNAVGQLPQCRLTHRIRDRRNLRLLLQGFVLISRTVTIPDTVGVSLLTNTVLIVPHAPRGNASADALRRNRMTQSVMGGFENAAGQLPQCRLTHRIRDRRNLRLLLQGFVSISRTVTIPDTVGVSLLTNTLLIVPHAPRGNASADALRRNTIAPTGFCVDPQTCGRHHRVTYSERDEGKLRLRGRERT
jgi:hypothetical protein